MTAIARPAGLLIPFAVAIILAALLVLAMIAGHTSGSGQYLAHSTAAVLD